MYYPVSLFIYTIHWEMWVEE